MKAGTIYKYKCILNSEWIDDEREYIQDRDDEDLSWSNMWQSFTSCAISMLKSTFESFQYINSKQNKIRVFNYEEDSSEGTSEFYFGFLIEILEDISESDLYSIIHDNFDTWTICNFEGYQTKLSLFQNNQYKLADESLIIKED